MSSQIRTIGLVVAAVIVFGSGIWLTRAGRPYGGVLLDVHKLVDLAAAIVIGIAVYQSNQARPLSVLEWALLAVAASLFVATLATGGVSSAMAEPPAWALWSHRIGSWAAGALVLAGVLLLGAR